MKKLFIALFILTPLFASAQSIYLAGGYVMDRPTVTDGLKENGYVTDVNGKTQIDHVKQNGFFVGVGTILKPKKTATFGLRIEAAYERQFLHMERTITAQVTPFMPQETFQSNVSSNNNYLRLTPTFSYIKKKNANTSYMADLGLTEMIHLGGYRESSSYLAVHASAGISYKYLALRAGAEIGAQNTLGGESKAYEVYSKRFFVGLNFNFVDAFGLKKKKVETEPAPTTE
jgi:hypothetical protein